MRAPGARPCTQRWAGLAVLVALGAADELRSEGRRRAVPPQYGSVETPERYAAEEMAERDAVLQEEAAPERAGPERPREAAPERALGVPRPAVDAPRPAGRPAQEDEDFRLLREDGAEDAQPHGSRLRRRRQVRLAAAREAAQQRRDRVWAPAATAGPEVERVEQPRQSFLGRLADQLHMTRRKASHRARAPGADGIDHEAMNAKFGDVNIDVLPIEPSCCEEGFDDTDSGAHSDCEGALKSHNASYDSADYAATRAAACGFAGRVGLVAVALLGLGV